MQITLSFCVTDFSLGFAKGLPHGIYDSGKGLLLFFSDLVIHPIRTSVQVFDSFVLLSQLAKSEEWEALAQTLTPEAHQLIKEWDTIPNENRGELAGYIFGKYGTDLLLPASLGKAMQKLRAAQEFGAACKKLSLAERTLLADALIGAESEAQVVEMLKAAQTTITLGEELGFTATEMGYLKQAGHLETTIAKNCEHLSLTMQESLALHKNARKILKPHAKKPMLENQARELIHSVGIPTFPRPEGVPENFLVMISDKGAGMEYVHPTNPHFRVRVMPGKPHSPNTCQQKPYVIQNTDKGALDSAGKYVAADLPAAHIPFEEFTYRNYLDGY